MPGGASLYGCLPTQYHCGFDYGYNMVHDALIFIFNIGVVSITMFFCYIRIYMVFRQSKTRIVNEMNSHTKGVKKVEFRLALQLLVLFALYNIFYMPIAILTLFANAQETAPTWLYITALTLAGCNSAVNIVIYLYYNTMFRLECLNLFGIQSQLVESKTSSRKRQTNKTAIEEPINVIS